MASPKIPIINNPALLDIVLGQLQSGLIENIESLDFAFGKAQRITQKIKEKVWVMPACFTGKGNDYENVQPNDKWGNFSFFHVTEPQEVVWTPNQLSQISTPFGIIFWYDLRKIFPESAAERNTEKVKDTILRALQLKIKLQAGRYEILKIFERPESVYREYPGILQLENQFMLHPFGCIRLDGILTIRQDCLYD